MKEMKASYWAVIPAAVRRDEVLPPNAKLLYGDISALTNERGYCYALNRYFCDLYGWSERTVQRLISALEERGYIRIESLPGTERRIYAGLQMGAETPDKIVGGRRQNCRGRGDNFVTPHNVDKDSIIIPPVSPQGAVRMKSEPKWKPEAFEKFWTYYRKHARGENRAEAAREWDKLKPDIDLLRVMGEALMRQVRSDQWQRGVGIPYACRWLKNRRWEDTPPITQTEGDDGGPVQVEDRGLPIWT